jgi:hypothetical protein
MTSQQSAIEHLRVIRSLMEKAHIYRAISAPAALVGGLLAVGAAIWSFLRWQHDPGSGCARCFLTFWLSILAVTASLNTALLAREAIRRGQKPFASEGMHMALRSLFPSFLVGGVFGIGLALFLENMTLAALVWVVCYGLALLATASFSPRSLVRLGWAFVIAGLLLFCAWAVSSEIRMLPTDEGPAAAVMGATFGLLHVVYSLAVFLGKKPEALRAE